MDYALRRDLLAAVRALHAEQGASACASQLLDTLHDGRVKLYLTWKILAERRTADALFSDGDYLPLKVHGDRSEQVCAFARQSGEEAMLVVVPRLLAGLMGETGDLPLGVQVWRDTWIELPQERLRPSWTDVLVERDLAARPCGEGSGLPVAAVFETFPCAVLRSRSA